MHIPFDSYLESIEPELRRLSPEARTAYLHGITAAQIWYEGLLRDLRKIDIRLSCDSPEYCGIIDETVERGTRLAQGVTGFVTRLQSEHTEADSSAAL